MFNHMEDEAETDALPMLVYAQQSISHEGVEQQAHAVCVCVSTLLQQKQRGGCGAWWSSSSSW